MAVDKTNRKIVHGLIHGNGVHLRTAIHELWRLQASSGLTEKEVKYLTREVDNLRAAADRLSKLREHLGKAL